MLALFIALLTGPGHPAVIEARALLAAELDGRAPLPDGERWPMRRQWITARRAPCPERVERIKALAPNGPGRDAETRLRWLLAAQIKCGVSPTATRKRLAIEHPRPTDPIDTLTADERRARARSFERQGDYDAAKAIWLALGTRADRFEVARLGLKRYRTDFPGVARQFEALVEGTDPLSADAAYFNAKALGRAGQTTAAIAAYDRVEARFPTHKRAADAAFFKAFSLYEAARRPKSATARKAAYLKAARVFSAVDAPSWERSAQWYAAWSKLLAGVPSAAAFDAIAQTARRGSSLRRKALYWAARADLSRQPVRTILRFTQLLEERTLDWYGLLIIQQFPALAPRAVVLGLKPEPPPEPLAGAVAEIRALQAAGLGWFARSNFARLRPQLRALKRTDLEASLAVEVGEAEETLRQATGRNQSILRHPPRAEDAPVWHAAYPVAYAPIIQQMASRQQVAPALIHGFIRKESAYAPDAVSTAHAKGLMQLIPRTARRIQQDRGLNEQAVDLHDPRTNIELGTWYVGVLAARYGHQAPVTKAAFNAGPAAVNSWRGAEAHVPLARWVESIPFLQAREYVKRLSATEVVYRMLLNGESLAHAVDAVLPASIDVHLDRGGVAY